jgi:hypothetical protein
MRFLFAILCLLSLIVELSFDSTNSFVRISASQSVSPLVVVLDSSVSSSSSEHPVVKNTSSKPTKPTKATVVYSMGHYAGPASSFTHFVPQDVNRVEHRYVWNYRHIDQFALLRPPIAASRA